MTAAQAQAAGVQGRMIRPPDPAIVGVTKRYMQIGSADACRRLLHLAFRDAHTVLDLTYAAGCFWEEPLPPGIDLITTNNLDARARTDLHLDFTDTGLPDGAYDLATYDPPHLADCGANSIMGRRFGTVKGTANLRLMVERGAIEAWRISRVGILVKIADSSHGGEFHQMTRWIEDVVPVRPYIDLHTYRAAPLRDGKHRQFRVPRNNGATYLAFRRGGHRHLSFDELYARRPAEQPSLFSAAADAVAG